MEDLAEDDEVSVVPSHRLRLTPQTWRKCRHAQCWTARSFYLHLGEETDQDLFDMELHYTPKIFHSIGSFLIRLKICLHHLDNKSDALEDVIGGLHPQISFLDLIESLCWHNCFIGRGGVDGVHVRKGFPMSILAEILPLQSDHCYQLPKSVLQKTVLFHGANN